MSRTLELAGTAAGVLLDHEETRGGVPEPVSEHRLTGKGAVSDTLAGGPRRAPQQASGDTPAREPALVAPRYSRRLSDKVLIAFHHACDQADFEIADQLLRILELMLVRRPVTPDGNRRRSIESLVAAHERLWHLRHPGDEHR